MYLQIKRFISRGPEAEKSHELRVELETHSEGLGTGGADGVSPSPKTEDRSPSSSRQVGSKGGCIPLSAFLFCSGPRWIGNAAHPREGHLLGPLTQLQASSGIESQAMLYLMRS